VILHAAESGAGPPVALLHGLFGRARNLASLARRLAACHRVISLDMRNHGASPHASDMRYATMAADVRETLISLGAWPACVLGHSMGGKVAMMLALLHPRSVSALVVADIAPIAYSHRNRVVTDAMRAIALTPGLTRADADAALRTAVPEPAVRNFLLQNLVLSPMPAWQIGLAEIAAALHELEAWPYHDAALTYDGPTRFIIGAHSDFVLPEHHSHIKRLFPSAQVVTIPDAGHWLHADQPEAFATAAEAALARAGGI
jgi:pimeloyl-ACP methyl ester carboxylesterase